MRLIKTRSYLITWYKSIETEVFLLNPGAMTKSD